MKNDPNKKTVTPLAEKIMESADWSTSSMTCIECIQNDLECSLDPIVKALSKRSRNHYARIAAKKLQKFYKKNRKISERILVAEVSRSAYTLYQKAIGIIAGRVHRIEICSFLRKNIEPVMEILQRSKDPSLLLLAKKLERITD